MEYVSGTNYDDKQSYELSNNQIIDISNILVKLHNTQIIDTDNDSWIIYLKNRINSCYQLMNNILPNELNSFINDYLLKYIDNKIDHKYKNSILHMDFRTGNLLFGKKTFLIDFESAKNGDYVFDFVRMFRNLPKEQFQILVDNYKSQKKIERNFYNKLDFYNFFDSYTSLGWCVQKNMINSDFYDLNYKILKEKIGKLYEKRNL
jgi:aminoglycoside phosphotransferase (APT) family kinase protein